MPCTGPDIPDVPFDQLAALVVFAQTGSVLGAAQRLGVSQPAVSHLLRRLEARFAEPLFTFEGNRKGLTAHGRALYESVERGVGELLSSYDRFQRFYAAPDQRRLRVAGRREIIERVIRAVDFPGTIEFQLLGSAAIVDALASRRCDVAIVQRDVDDPRFTVTPVYESDVVLALPARSSPKTRNVRDLLTLERFATEPFVAYRSPHPFIDELSASCEADLTPKRIVRSCEDWALVAELVAAGHGFTVMPAEFTQRAAVRALPLSPALVAPVTFKAVCLTDLLAAPGIAAFLKQLREM